MNISILLLSGIKRSDYKLSPTYWFPLLYAECSSRDWLMAKTEIVDVFWKLWLYWGSRICKSSFSLGALLIPSVFFLCTHFLSLSNFSKYPQIPTSSVWMPFCSVSLDRCCFHIWPALSLSHAIRISTFSCFNFFPEKQFAPLHYRPEWGNMKHPFCTSLCHDHLDQIQKMNEIVCFN